MALTSTTAGAAPAVIGGDPVGRATSAARTTPGGPGPTVVATPARPVGRVAVPPVPVARGRDTPAPGRRRGTVEHQGSFLYATCPPCGWRGPGRRASSSAVTDLEHHDLASHGPDAD